MSVSFITFLFLVAHGVLNLDILFVVYVSYWSETLHAIVSSGVALLQIFPGLTKSIMVIHPPQSILELLGWLE